jgi:glutamate synthase (NADPH/NADH) large chain
MSGGFAYVWRLDRARVNEELVDLVAVPDEHAETLKSLVELHRAETGSPVAERLLESWPRSLAEFTAVIPRDFQRVVRVIKAAAAAGRDIDETIMAELAALGSSPPPAGSPSVAAGIGSGPPVGSAPPVQPADAAEAEVAHA